MEGDALTSLPQHRAGRAARRSPRRGRRRRGAGRARGKSTRDTGPVLREKKQTSPQTAAPTSLTSPGAARQGRPHRPSGSPPAPRSKEKKPPAGDRQKPVADARAFPAVRKTAKPLHLSTSSNQRAPPSCSASAVQREMHSPRRQALPAVAGSAGCDPLPPSPPAPPKPPLPALAFLRCVCPPSRLVSGEGSITGAWLKASSSVLNRPDRRPRYTTRVVPRAPRTKLTPPAKAVLVGRACARDTQHGGSGGASCGPLPSETSCVRLKETSAWVNVGRFTLNALGCDFSGCPHSHSLVDKLGKRSGWSTDLLVDQHLSTRTLFNWVLNCSDICHKL